MSTPNSSATEPIAIISMQGRFPKARNVDEFWQNLVAGVECVSFFTEQELQAVGEDPTLLGVPGIVNAGGVLDDVDLFDAQFFGFSARDAEIRDPQQRLFLECAWESLEAAGYNPEGYPGTVGVYGGCGLSTYLLHLYANPDRLANVDGYSLAIANDKDYLTTTVSYKLNLRGPSFAVQTACSTSLVAVCIACQALLARECDLALAGGVSIGLPQRRLYEYQPGGILSPDGHCRPFDANAQGTVGGNGVGVVVLKLLSKAMQDGDQVRAVIRGVGLNNDGCMKVGFTAPSVEGQAQVIKKAHQMADVHPETITYVEAHGTGTPLGDPIEIAALTEAFSARTSRKQYCAVGSVKSNLGHLDAAAGVTGLIKTVLCLENGLIPPTLHFHQTNPDIDFKNSPFYVNASLAEWKRGNDPRRAAVSSFGIGGTNAHVVLEEAPPRPATPSTRSHHLIVLSARTATALQTATDRLVDHLRRNPGLDAADVAYTLQTGRKAFRHSLMLVTEGSDTAAFLVALKNRDASCVVGTAKENERPIVFLFPGQGSQYLGMGLELYRKEQGFREHLDHCAEILKSLIDIDLRDLLYPSDEFRAEAQDLLGRTAFTQPALFAVEYALAKLWMEWGVRPNAMIGHSIGEYVAACLAGVFSLEDALGVVAVRGLLMDEMEPGAMLSVPLSEHEIAPLLQDATCLAAVNAPALCVLSGPEAAIHAASAQLAAHGINGRRLHTSHAFHSSMMDPMLDAFGQEISAVRLNAPVIPYLSNLTGTWIAADQAADPEYYLRHLRETVRYADCIQEVFKDPDCVLLEVGPGQVLGSLARQPANGKDRIILSSLRSANGGELDDRFILTNLGRTWMSGVPIDWQAFHRREKRLRVQLPTYPFERQRYWIGPPESIEAAAVGPADKRDWFYLPTWKPMLPVGKYSVAPRKWLVFLDALGLGRQVFKQLLEGGSDVIVALPAAAVGGWIDANTYGIRADVPSDYEDLIANLISRGLAPEVIAHLWTAQAYDSQAGPLVDPSSFDQEQTRGFYSLVFLAKALARYAIKETIQVGVISTNLQAVTGAEPLDPCKGTVLGAARVISQEVPNLRCRCIDLLQLEIEQEPEALAKLIIAELTTEPFHAVVAYRGNRRWIQIFDRIQLAPAALTEESRLRNGGVYVITGGLGRIGLAIAEYLSQKVKARLVLIGRSPLPDRSQWGAHLLARPDDKTSRTIRDLMNIEKLGGEVLVISADAGIRSEMSSAIERAIQRFGTIHGVIHGAGNTSDNGVFPLSQTDTVLSGEHFRPKAHGAMILHDLLQSQQLDFVLLHSSLSALLGGIGFTAYAAANCFLDAFAAWQNQRLSTPWISVEWDSWEFPENGMQTDDWTPTMDAIPPRDGASAFHQVLDSGFTQVAVSVGDLDARFAEWVELESLQRATAATQAAAARHPRPDLTTEYVAPRNRFEETLAGIWEELLAISPVGIQDNFFELGGHSLLAIQLLSRLNAALQIDVAVQRIFEAPTIAELVASLERDRAGTAVDQDQLAEMLEWIEKLSASDVKALTQQHLSAREPNGGRS
jgi:acyl transferase domain-containing protein